MDAGAWVDDGTVGMMATRALGHRKRIQDGMHA